MIRFNNIQHKREQIYIKLLSKAGETLTETMVALLIASLGLVILAGAVSTTTRIVQRSEGVLESYYDLNNEVAQQPNKTDGNLTIQIKPVSGNYLSENSFNTKGYTNSYFTKTPIVSYHELES